MDEFPIITFTTSLWKLLVFLVILIVAFHVILNRVFKFGKIAWKRSDYVWLSLTALGLISLSGEIRIRIAESWLLTAKAQTQYSLHSIRTNLVTSPPTYLCRTFVKNENAQSNIEDTQRQYDLACKWLKSAPSILPPNDDPPFKPLSFEDTHFPSTVSDPIILETVSWTRRLFQEYEDRRKAFEELQRRTERTAAESVNSVLSPIVLCLALALRMSKVAGEIRLEKVKERSTVFWVFGYGSLMWDSWEQQFPPATKVRASIVGFRRAFNKASVKNWGSKAKPGPTLNLEQCKDAKCEGFAFSFLQEDRDEVFDYLERREGGFRFEIVSITIAGKEPLDAYAPIYSGKNLISGKTTSELAEMVCAASGTSGECRTYVKNISTQLSGIGIHDEVVSAFHEAVQNASKEADRDQPPPGSAG